MIENACTKCETTLDESANFCGKCGAKKSALSSPFNKSAKITLLLAFFFGVWGIHRLYVGKIRSGIAMLFTWGGLGIWTLVDLILIVNNKFKDKQKNALEFLKNPAQIKRIFVTLGIVLLYLIMFADIIKFFVTHRSSSVTHSQTTFTALNLKKPLPYTPIETQINSLPGFNKNSYLPIAEKKIVTQPKKVPSSLPKNILTVLFENKHDRYSIKYPEDWQFSLSKNGPVKFNRKKGTAGYFSVINIDVVPVRSARRNSMPIKQFTLAQKNQILSHKNNAKIVGQGEIELQQEREKLSGEVIVFTFNDKNQNFKQIQFIIAKEDPAAFYIWSYTSPLSQYNADLPIAEAMYHSWVIN